MCMLTLHKSQFSIIKKETQKSIYKKGGSGSFHYHLHNTCVFYAKREVPAQQHRSAHINQAIAFPVHVNYAIVSHQENLKGKRADKAEFTLDNAEVKKCSLPHFIVRLRASLAAFPPENIFIYLTAQHTIACVHLLYKRKE